MEAVRGRLITATFARHLLRDVEGVTDPPPTFPRAIHRWWEDAERTLGPASAVRTVADAAAVPLLRLLGFDVIAHEPFPDCICLRTCAGDDAGPLVVIVSWNQPLHDRWRAVVLRAISADARGVVLFNGPTLRIADARRTWTRDTLEFNLPSLPSDADACRLFWCTVTAAASTGSHPLLDRLVDLSARHGVEVCRALGTGVLDALATLLAAMRSSRVRGAAPAVRFEHSLTLLYRVLFLLFAEARGLVPLWHPVYRDRYSIDAIVTALMAGRGYRGLWQAIQAISRLAHAGCSAGELKVTAFNGRLFSPSQATSFDRTRIDDDTMSRAILSVSTTDAKRSRVRISYADLDVEQLGAVYERVLEYEPANASAPDVLTRTRDARKSSGTFYTPRAVTAHLVRRTLEPLVRGRTASDILALRIVDPAMGSGAFLVGACRYLAAAAEDALIREGTWHPGDVTQSDRVALRRDIASRCLYGVDLNPMAVQLARLSLWLATLAADKPLSFLDHHLICGDSLVGASLTDLERQPTRQATRGRAGPLPLFENVEIDTPLQDAARARVAMALQADDSVDVVRAKERSLGMLRQEEGPLGRWSSVLDLWCAGWFWNAGRPPDRATFLDLADRLLRGRSSLPASVTEPLLEHAQMLAAERRFLHWPLVFPEVMADVDGCRGFDAVLGNPPWDMMRGDSGGDDLRRERQRDARNLSDFVRDSGIYHVGSRAHVNRYQLFVERGLQLLRPGGRLGLVLPSGIASDAGAAPLRRHLFERAHVDAITGLDNHTGIFPIHRSVRFVLLTCTHGSPTTSFACRFGISRAEELDTPASGTAPMVLTRRLLERVSGTDDLGIPEIATEADLRLVERISTRVPWLGREDGWHVAFGRELNASDDRDAFARATHRPWSRPIVEGKQLGPFRVALDRSVLELQSDAAKQHRIARVPRLAYRDVASATNRLTLIAAIVPARAVTTHTLFCLRTRLPLEGQQVLCGLLNSFVANYLVRFRVNTHVTVALVSRLPVPLLRTGDRAFARLASLAHTLAQSTHPAEQMPEYAELQAIAAHLYGLDEDDFRHVLSTFPLIDAGVKDACVRAFRSSR